MAALALLEVALAGRAVRPAMVRRLGRVLRRLVGPAEALVMAAGLPPLGPLAEALMEAHGELAGAGIVGLALGPSRAVAEALEIGAIGEAPAGRSVVGPGTLRPRPRPSYPLTH